MTENVRNSKAREETLAETRPELDDNWFAEADAYVGTRLVRRGRPPAANPKVAVSLRLDPDVIAYFKKDGRGWQSRMNEQLRKAAGL